MLCFLHSVYSVERVIKDCSFIFELHDIFFYLAKCILVEVVNTHLWEQYTMLIWIQTCDIFTLTNMKLRCDLVSWIGEK